jgi:UDP-N-acetylmuramate dehydrogenase
MQLANLTTFKIGGEVEVLYEFEEGVRVFGNLSNTLVSSFGYDKPIVLTSKMDKIEIDGTKVHAQCGVKGPLLALKTAEAGLSGFEFMCFPASVGGMVRMNAGAHGQTISDNLVSVTSTSPISPPEFGYRTSSYKDAVILSAEFELEPKNQDEIKAKMQENLEFRKTRQPRMPSVGSVFKNPKGDFAGRLLDDCKGLTVGGAQVWENHANFIINTGSATSTDVLKLMLMMYNRVRENFGVELQPEIEYLGSNEEELGIWTKISK